MGKLREREGRSSVKGVENEESNPEHSGEHLQRAGQSKAGGWALRLHLHEEREPGPHSHAGCISRLHSVPLVSAYLSSAVMHPQTASGFLATFPQCPTRCSGPDVEGSLRHIRRREAGDTGLGHRTFSLLQYLFGPG